MSVYVDSMREHYERMIMCHMLADSTAELIAMADKIGVARKWIQHAGTHREHFDVCLAKRKLAVKLGAIEITFHELGAMLRARREGRRVMDNGASETRFGRNSTNDRRYRPRRGYKGALKVGRDVLTRDNVVAAEAEYEHR